METKNTPKRREGKSTGKSSDMNFSKTAAIYVRKSTLDSRDGEARSLSGQARKANGYAAQNDLTVVGQYQEALGTSVSKFSKKATPQLHQALEDMENKVFHTLIIEKLDRQTRRGAMDIPTLLFLDRVVKSGGRLVSIEDGIDTDELSEFGGVIKFTVAAEMAKQESENISMRVKRGKEEQRIRNEYQGGSVVFGLMAKRTPNEPTVLVRDEEAIEMINEAADMILDGASSVEVCKQWNAQGRKSGQGGNWRDTTLRRILSNPAMIGHRKMLDDVARDEHGEPIVCEWGELIPAAKFYALKDVLASRQRKTKKGKKTSGGGPQQALFAGLILCSCGSRMHRENHKSKKGEKYSYYRCPSHPSAHMISSDIFEDHVIDQALTMLSQEDPESDLIAEVSRRWLHTFNPASISSRNKMVQEAKVIQGRISELEDRFFVDGAISKERFEDLESALQGKLVTLEAEIALIPEVNDDISPLFDLAQCGDDPESGLTGEGSAWANLEHHKQREIIRCLIDQVLVTKREGDKPRTNIPERCEITFATSENAAELGARGERILAPGISRKAKVAS